MTQPPTVALGDVAEVQGGLQVTRKRASLPIEVPYLRVANVYRDRLELHEMKTMRVSERELSRVALQRGDILVVEGHGNPLEIGRTSVWNGSIEPCIHQNHLIRVRLRNGSATPNYVSTFLNSPVGRRQLIKAGRTTSGLNTINITNVRELQIPLPPLPEQKRIAAILDKADEIRRKRQQALELTEQLLRSAFLDMFGDPVTNPKGWPVKTLGELCPERGMIVDGPFGSSLKPSAYVDSGVRVVRNFNIKDDWFDGSAYKYVTQEKFEELRRSEVLPNDILISTKGTIGRVCVMPSLEGPALLSASGTVRIRLPNLMLPAFVVAQMIVPRYKAYLKGFEAGSNQKYLNLSAIRKFELVVPPVDAQRDFVRLRDAVLAARRRLASALLKQEELGSSLTQRAFRGEL